MSRPQRIEFDNAYYHVMNRGAGRRDIFEDDNDREQFLIIVKEAHTQFGIEIHAYCLMSTHYHLLIKTPRGNLGRAMRHINGVFTQRLNRAKDIDGLLFRILTGPLHQVGWFGRKYMDKFQRQSIKQNTIDYLWRILL